MRIRWIFVPFLVWLTACAGAGGRGLTPPQTPLNAVVRHVQEAVVTIVTYDADRSISGIGTGFFVDGKGHLITSYHVLDGAITAEVRTFGGETYPVAEVVAGNPDLDLVKARAAVPESGVAWVPVTEAEPQITDRVVVVGSPLGLEQTVSEGIVSAVRELPSVGHVFQLSAPVSPGSSGSPVINLKGEVIGVVSFQAAVGQNLNFAVSGRGLLLLKPEANTPTLSSWTYLKNRDKPAKTAELCRQGFSHAVQGEPEEALKFYREAAQESPSDPEVWSGLGHCYVGMGETDEAISAYRKAIAADPGQVDARYHLAHYLRLLGQDEAALAAYAEVLRIDPAHAPTHFDMGVIYGRLGRLEEEAAAFGEVVRILPEHVPALYRLGLVLGQLGRLDEALEVLSRAIDLNPRFAPAYFGRGVVYGMKKDAKEEAAAYRTAIRVDPDFAPAHYNMAILYIDGGDRREALEEYKVLLHLDEGLAEDLFTRIYGKE